jgi:hypothetical protein
VAIITCIVRALGWGLWQGRCFGLGLGGFEVGWDSLVSPVAHRLVVISAPQEEGRC